MPIIAILDANVLYPQSLRDILLSLAEAKLYRPHWSKQIEEEWVRHVLADRPDLTAEQLARTCFLMDKYFPEACVDGFESRIEQLTLSDPDDRHILAAAIEIEATHIVTFNLRDFPAELLAPIGIEAIHPDQFLLKLLAQNSDSMCLAIREMRGRLSKPSYSAEETLESISRVGLPQTAAALVHFIDQI